MANMKALPGRLAPPSPPISIGLCAALGLALIFNQAAWGQETYKLSDEETWQKTSNLDPASPEGQLQEARRALAEKQFSRAENLATRWIEQHEQHPLLPEAYLVRGDALRADGDEYKALFDYELVARTYTGSEAFITACRRELDIAEQYSRGLYRKLWGMRILPADDEAEEIYIRVQERMPGSRLGEEAGMELGDFYFERRKMTLAADAYALFIENYPKSTQLEKAQRRVIYANLASFKGPEFDPRGLYEARSRLEQLRIVRPVLAEKMGADALLIRIDESDAAKMLSTARWYMHVDDPIAAEFTIRRLVKKYPRSVATADALRLIPEILPQLPKRVLAQAPDYQSMHSAVPAAQNSSSQPGSVP
jgi:outer membrane protein assembly factor BamD (BamD/ComL family)